MIGGFWIPSVVPKGRPRFNKAGVIFTPRRTHKFEHEVGWLARKAGYQPFRGPVAVEVEIIFCPPKTWKKADRALSIGQWADDCSTDTDNVVKAVLDGMNGVAYLDDKQVCSITATKRWGEVAGIWIKVLPLHEIEVNSGTG